MYNKLAVQYELRAGYLRPGIEESIKMLNKYLKRGTVLNIGCGVGLAIQILREYGLTPEGIDFSKEMIKHVIKRNPGCRFIYSDFKNYKFVNNYDGLLALPLFICFQKMKMNYYC